LLARENGARSVAYPAISCGVYGYPADAAARIAATEVRRLLDAYEDVDRVVLVAFNARLESVLRAAVAAAS
jgi:O-acetyl-ADP-ribose deacetylase (regulator of RNase III)